MMTTTMTKTMAAAVIEVVVPHGRAGDDKYRVRAKHNGDGNWNITKQGSTSITMAVQECF